MALTRFNNNAIGETITAAKGGTGVTSAGEIGNLVLLNSASGTDDVASLTIGSTYINSTYDDYLIKIYLSPATDAQKARIKLQSGGSDISGSTDYKFRGNEFGSNTYQYKQSSGGSQIDINDSISAGNQEGEGGFYHIELYNVNSTTIPCSLRSFGQTKNSAGNLRSENFVAVLVDRTTVVNGIKFFMDSGDINAYEYKIYGLKKS